MAPKDQAIKDSVHGILFREWALTEGADSSIEFKKKTGLAVGDVEYIRLPRGNGVKGRTNQELPRGIRAFCLGYSIQSIQGTDLLEPA